MCSFHLLLLQKLLKLYSLIHLVTKSILQLYNIYIIIWNNSLVVTILKPLIRNQGHSCQPRPAALYFLHSGHWLPVVSNNFFFSELLTMDSCSGHGLLLFHLWQTPCWTVDDKLKGSWDCPDPSHICVLLGSGMKSDWLAGRPSLHCVRKCPHHCWATHSLYWSPDMRMSETLRMRHTYTHADGI